MRIAGRSDADADERTRKLFALSLSDSHPKLYAERTREVNMAAPDDYTSMPWAPRSTLPPTTDAALSSDASDSGESTGSCDDNISMTGYASFFALPRQNKRNQVLIEQLTASHAAQRALVSQVEGLERELAQSRKREEAIKAVFFREFEKERQLFIEDKRLREKSARLEEKSKKIQKAMKALEEKELGLEVSTAFRLGDEGFNEDPTDSDCVGDDHIAIRAPSHSYPFSYGKTALLKLNKIKNCCSIVDTKDKRFDLLRRHDYYSGWLDAMRALDHKKAIKMDVKQIRCETRDLVLNESTHYLRDLNHPQNPRNAGVNVGLLFAYSALCTQYNLSHRDRRLDVRQWDLSYLNPVAREDLFGEFAFWDGVDYAVDKMKTLFTMKIERGIWRTSDDAAQIELMRTADMKRGYDVVPGRLQVEAHPRFPLPDVRTRSSQ